MGDVGKFAVAHAQQAGVQVRAVALSDESVDWKPLSSVVCSYEATDPKDIGADNIDVADPLLKELASKALRESSATKIDVASPEAQEQLRKELQGADAVIACLGSRQDGVSRWCRLGADKLTSAMQSAKVSRLVTLSSFGVGDDFMPASFISSFWGCLLRTVWRSALADLRGAEAVVVESGTDYLLVRPVGLTPEEPEKGSWKLLTKPKSGSLAMSIAKGDVAGFMVSEALRPTLSRTAVTIGQ
jgi:hypothetical protein